MLAAQMATDLKQHSNSNNNATNSTNNNKLERRDSTTSESSLEHLDLGRTPKKLKTHSSATSTPRHANNVNSNGGYSSGGGSSTANSYVFEEPQQLVTATTTTNTNNINNSEPTTNDVNSNSSSNSQQKRRYTARLQSQRTHETDESHDYDDEESADEKKSHTQQRLQRHHKRRGTHRLDKRTSVQLEYNPDNPNSLRKKFRFNRSSGSETNTTTTTTPGAIVDLANSTMANNESGFVDATNNSSSQYLNASTSLVTNNISTQKVENSTLNSEQHSSASSSPHNADNGASSVSSPESGIGEREDMKYVCPICEVVSATPHEFTNHIRCHNYNSGDSLNFTCRICSKVLSSASSLDRHVLVHTGERPFNCKYCHLTFTTNGNMHRHMRTHKQHQSTHHRRYSNGNKTNNSNSNSNTNSTAAAATTTTAVPGTNSTSANAAATTTTIINTNVNINTKPAHAQLTNGIGNIIAEGVNKIKTASETTVTATVTAATTANNNNETGANGKRFNSNSGNGGIESCESDGGGSCSTNSSTSAISQSSNKNNNNNCNTNNNNHNSNNINNNTQNNFKRKSSNTTHAHHLDVDDEITLMKRRVKTTINNNIILAPTNDDNHAIINEQQQSQQHQRTTINTIATNNLTCPLCDATDFENMFVLGAHFDNEHPDIPAKCRDCDVVFRTHRQLNVHPCSKKPMNCFDRYPLIAKSLAKQNSNEKETSNEINVTKLSPRKLSHSESSGDDSEAEDNQQTLEESAETDGEQQRRADFFRHLYLQNKTLNPMTSSPPPMDEQQFNERLESIKSETESEKHGQNLLSQDSKDLADIQSILNMTSSSSTSNFLRNLEQSVNTPSSNCSIDKDEEEAQDAYRSEIRKMKLRGEFPCKLCKEKFRNLRALKGHIKEHSSPAGPFRCTVCSYTIIDKAAFRQHMLTHKGDRPYECVVCNFAFTTKANCERHLRNIHAMTTRDEVKRAIIYHPSEDSSCDDPTKKLHLFSSPEFDDDTEMPYHNHHPKDRSTPVSHLKEMLTSESPISKPMKIQVKSLEQLLDKSNAPVENFDDSFEDKRPNSVHSQPEPAPMDLSMDVLDLSKKPSTSKPLENINACAPTEPSMPTPAMKPLGEDDYAEASKQLMESMRAMLPFRLPFLFDMPMPLPSLEEFQAFLPFMNRFLKEAGNNFPTLPLPLNTAGIPNNANPTNLPPAMAPPTSLLPPINPPSTANLNNISPNSAMNQLLSKSLNLPPPNNAPINIHRQSQMTPTVLPGGPVKMVIKNGVLMPKQKQRRYRTERPFACEHCSARFTLRSNMERHVKQQHPQFYAQRQRSGHHIMRGRGASSAAAMNSFTHLQAAFAHAQNNGLNHGMGNVPATISEQVKHAILTQQLKARKDTEFLHQALAHGSSSLTANQLLMDVERQQQQFNLGHHINGAMEDDEPKLIIDEDDDEDMEDDEVEEVSSYIDENQEEDNKESTISSMPEEAVLVPSTIEDAKPSMASIINNAAKKVSESLLEQAITALRQKNNGIKKIEIQPPAPAVVPSAPAPPANSMKTMMAQAESVGKFLKEVAISPFKDESQDLVPVSKLVDNATNATANFNSYFRPSDVANHMEQSDEEGLVASGSASESNNSGTEDIITTVEPKKKSAYSLAPNRVSCPYCQRMFPWSSSLRRHILTHTGQKPFKCSHCPLLFTTKSNCDRHLLRKHGNVESAMSVYMPTEDVNEPIPVPKSVEEIEQQKRQREEEEKRRKLEEEKQARDRLEQEKRKQVQQQQQQQLQKQEQEQQQLLLKQLVAAAHLNQTNAVNGLQKVEQNSISSSDLPYKCHLCESSFGERFQCLDHINNQHKQEFLLLLSKGAIDINAEQNQAQSNDDEEMRAPPVGNEDFGSSAKSGGKFPDYSNRKVICAFCVRRFWSTEDLRRHMRTHSGERPFQCEVCFRKFTLKHSMLRHMKKHGGHHSNGAISGDLSAAGNSGSDFSDDEQMPMSATTTSTTTSNPTTMTTSSSSLSFRTPKIQELLNKANEWRTSRLVGEQKENISEEHNQQTDLIGNLLGISDQGILNKLLTSADEAAKLLGVEK